jgi:hypothetical protein
MVEAQLVTGSCSPVATAASCGGQISQPRRQPVMAKDLDAPDTTKTRSAASKLPADTCSPSKTMSS